MDNDFRDNLRNFPDTWVCSGDVPPGNPFQLKSIEVYGGRDASEGRACGFAIEVRLWNNKIRGKSTP